MTHIQENRSKSKEPFEHPGNSMDRRTFLKNSAVIGAGGFVLSNQAMDVRMGGKHRNPFRLQQSSSSKFDRYRIKCNPVDWMSFDMNALTIKVEK